MPFALPITEERRQEIRTIVLRDYYEAFTQAPELARELSSLSDRLPGVRNPSWLWFLACKCRESCITNAQFSRGMTPWMGMTLGGNNLKDHPPLDPPAIIKHGDPDDAVWLNMLNTHCGWDVPEHAMYIYTAGTFTEPVFTWARVLADLQGFEAWFTSSIQQLNALSFGSHRIYETHSLTSRKGTLSVIRSFIEWARGEPYLTLNELIERYPSQYVDRSHARWHNVMLDLDVLRFGRTARWDFIRVWSLVGRTKALPPYPYLEGSPRPRTGAAKLFIDGYKLGDPIPKSAFAWLNESTVDLSRLTSAAILEYEDAFCNWRKDQELSDHESRLELWGKPY